MGEQYLTEYFDMTYEDLKQLYNENFSLGYLNIDVGNKLALIALTCHLTKKAQAQKPDITPYKILMQITAKDPLPEKFIKGLAVMCEDFMYGCTEFPTFGVATPGEMAKYIAKNLHEYLPF